jgi:hypothetical protein
MTGLRGITNGRKIDMATNDKRDTTETLQM